VCRYVWIDNVVVENDQWQGITVVDKFNTGIISYLNTTMEAIVMIDHDQLQLWVVDQNVKTAIDEVHNTHNMIKKLIKNNHLLIYRYGKWYRIDGQIVNE